MKRWSVLLVGAGLVVATLLLLVIPALLPPDLETGVLLDNQEPIPDFTLTNGNGERVSFSEWRGKHLLVFFGYTNCPDVCPTTLGDLARATEELGPLAEQTQVIFITVDPERDTPERVGQYVSAFNDSFVGLTGTVEEVRTVASAFGAAFQKEESESAVGYLMGHSAHVTVVDPQGRARALFGFGTRGDAIAADMRKLLQ